MFERLRLKKKLNNSTSLNEYLQNIHTIKGWCNPALWQCIQPIHKYQVNNNIVGGVGEIGVFHGKFFIGLALTKQESETPNYAIDVFDMQEFNLDEAGKGNKRIFEKNLQSYQLEKYTEIVKVDSAQFPPELLNTIQKATKFSLFSIDGCHTPEHTINDLKIVLQLIHPGGIIFVDDYNNPDWPGVQEGISKFYFNGYCNFIPLLFTCNKLFLCNYAYHKPYLQVVSKHLKKNFSSTKVKLVKRFGYDTLTVRPTMKEKNFLVL